MGGGIDLSNFIDSDAVEEANQVPALPSPTNDEPVDEAMGDVFDPFSDRPEAGAIQRDGTVLNTPESDSITELATTGEKRLHWGIMVSMILVYSVVGWMVGTILPPMVGLFGLLALSVLGFVLGERWVPDPSMRMLGITWVIITMKLLYGLAIDLHHWELWGVFPIDAMSLGGLLLVLVAVNIWVSYHHDEDAIAAQATLVLLAIGSGAGAVYGELGVAGGIVMATMLLHGLALHRQSGNLASLGIAASNIWIGLHAFSDGWSIGALEIVKFDDPLLLFLLLGGVNAFNATMAAHFSKNDNWFSDGLAVVGLGKPGLWSVSVGLGMIGGLLAIAANRAETSYSLALIMLLLALFGGSYLIVRGVEMKRVMLPLGLGLPILVTVLVVQSALSNTIGIIGEYQVFALGAALLTAGVLLANQTLVSDHVLWGGSLVLVILLTILIPSTSSSSGGDGGRLLLAALSVIHIGTAALALLRRSPALAGVTILTPWLWVLAISLWAGSARTFNAANQSWELEAGVVGWDPWFVIAYLILATVLQYPVNRSLGESGVNLAARLVGLSELGARLRDSGLLRLWNLGYVLALIVWLTITRSESMPAYGLLIGVGTLLALHVTAHCQGIHQENPRMLVVLFSITAVWFQWRHGLDVAWIVMLCLALAALVQFDRRFEIEESISLMMGLLTVQIVIFSLDQQITDLQGVDELLSESTTGAVALLAVVLALALYLPRAGTMEKLLKPATSSVAMLFAAIWMSMSSDMTFLHLAVAMALFVISGGWLAAQGEIRSELKAVGKRDARRERIERMAEIQNLLKVEAPEQAATKLLGLERSLLPEATGTSSSSSEVSSTTALTTPGQSAVGTAEKRVYHFDSEETASLAQEGDKIQVEAMSQAVSVGEVKTVAPELYMHAERMRKKAKRRGQLSTEEILYGDIHHKPVIVQAFIAGLIVFGLYLVWQSGSATPGILVAVGAVSLMLIGISRWRASTNNLTLPDMFGMETPFVATVAGLTILQVVGRLAPGATMSNQLDFGILAIVLLLIVGMSLTGRKDFVHRIPSTIEWLVGALLISRFAGAVVAGTMPLPVLTDPFTLPSGSTTLVYTTPFLMVESLLLLCVVGWDWIEGVRRKAGLPDFHGAAGRGGWVLMVSLLSIGPVALVAIILGLRRGIQWSQPAAVGIGVIAIVVATLALSSWIEPIEGTATWVMISLGLFSLISLAATVPMRKPAWTSIWAWDAHLLLSLGLILLFGGISAWLVVAFLALSLAVWVAGILQLRRSFRIWGAADLVIALVCAAMAAQGVIDPMMVLIMLVALGIELGIVAWLGQKHEGQLAID